MRKKIRSGIIYYYRCSNCKGTCRGKTFRHLYTRAAEHIGISNLPEKRLKKVKESAISDHLFQCNCAINFDDFGVLAADCNKLTSRRLGRTEADDDNVKCQNAPRKDMCLC